LGSALKPLQLRMNRHEEILSDCGAQKHQEAEEVPSGERRSAAADGRTDRGLQHGSGRADRGAWQGEHRGGAASLPGDDQPDRESALGSPDADASGKLLAGRKNGPSLGGIRLLGDGEELPPHPGLQGAEDAQGEVWRQSCVDIVLRWWLKMRIMVSCYELPTRSETPSCFRPLQYSFPLELGVRVYLNDHKFLCQLVYLHMLCLSSLGKEEARRRTYKQQSGTYNSPLSIASGNSTMWPVAISDRSLRAPHPAGYSSPRMRMAGT